jgi:hypothetical protein
MTSTAPESLPALGICLEEYEYPYPVRFLPLSNDLQQVLMAQPSKFLAEFLPFLAN